MSSESPDQFSDGSPLSLASVTSIPLPGRHGGRRRVVVAAGAFVGGGTGTLVTPAATPAPPATAPPTTASPTTDRTPPVRRIRPVPPVPGPATTDTLPAVPAVPAAPATPVTAAAPVAPSAARTAPAPSTGTRPAPVAEPRRAGPPATRETPPPAQPTSAQANPAQPPRFGPPVRGTVIAGFEARWGSFHYGIDIAAPWHSPIRAVADGVIVEAGPVRGFGLWVRERLADGTVLVYGHMADFGVRPGRHVRAGEQIARAGNRGETNGEHLHFEVWTPDGRKVDPRRWLAERGVGL